MTKKNILVIASLITVSFICLSLVNKYLNNKITGVANAVVLETNETDQLKVFPEEGWNKYVINELDGYLEKADVLKSDNKIILLLGIDSRDVSLTGRSDSILLMKFDKESNSAKLVSIPRDSYVNIDGRGFDKINHAYAFGGNELSKKTVEDLLGLEIDHVASINFKSFEEVIDVLGGVKVDSPFKFSEKLSNGNIVEFSKGVQLLSGEHALAYARMRKQDAEGDLGRGKRQQEIISSLLTEFKDFSNIFKIKTLYNKFNDNVLTDIELVDILELLPNLNHLNNIEKYQLKGNPVILNRISYYEVDKDSLFEIRELLKD